jgi:hypothetical protein
MRKQSNSPALLLFVFVLILFSPPQAEAQVSSVEDFSREVAGVAGTNYLDLLRKIFPDVAPGSQSTPDTIARTSIPLRHLFGDYENKVYTGEMKIGSLEALWLKDGGRKHLLLLVGVSAESEEAEINWGEMHVLALFQTVPTIRLLDAVDIQADRFAGFWDEQPVLAIGREKDAVMVQSSHHNSSQGYQSLALVSAEQGKLKSLFDLPVLLNSNTCGQNFAQEATLSVLKDSAGDHRPILVRIKMVKEPDGEDCERRTRGYTKFYKALLVWNPSRREYSSRGRELKNLARFNEKNF